MSDGTDSRNYNQTTKVYSGYATSAINSASPNCLRAGHRGAHFDVSLSIFPFVHVALKTRCLRRKLFISKSFSEVKPTCRIQQPKVFKHRVQRENILAVCYLVSQPFQVQKQQSCWWRKEGQIINNNKHTRTPEAKNLISAWGTSVLKSNLHIGH